MALVVKIAAGVILGLVGFALLVVVGNAVVYELTQGPVDRQRAACVGPVGIWFEATRQCLGRTGPVDALTGAPLAPTYTPFPAFDACMGRGGWWSMAENRCVGGTPTRAP